MKKVYLIRAAQFYKIGISANIPKRLAAVQTGCPITCEYVGYFPSADPEQLERHLHLAFQDFKTKGEWFDLGDDNVKRLITQYNLKHVVNPYAEVTRETERTSSSPALEEARDVSAEVNIIGMLFSECYRGKALTDNGKQIIRRLLVKYGTRAVSESIKDLSSKVDLDKFWDKIPYSCKSYATHGRHVNQLTWRLYFGVLEKYGQDAANELLMFTMKHQLDDDKPFHTYIKDWCTEIHPEEYDFGGVLFWYKCNILYPSQKAEANG